MKNRIAILILTMATIPGAPVSDPDEDLRKAVEKGQVARIQDLLDKGDDPLSADKKGRTALSIAQEKKNADVLRLLAGTWQITDVQAGLSRKFKFASGNWETPSGPTERFLEIRAQFRNSARPVIDTREIRARVQGARAAESGSAGALAIGPMAHDGECGYLPLPPRSRVTGTIATRNGGIQIFRATNESATFRITQSPSPLCLVFPWREGLPGGIVLDFDGTETPVRISASVGN